MQNILKKENIYILILIFSFGFILNWFLKSEIIITNSDDLKSLYRGFRSLNGGLSGFYETTLDLALKQGRGYFIYTDFFSHLPYLFHNEIMRSSFITLIYSLSGLTLYYIIYKFTKRLNICNAFLIIFFTSVPVYGSWYAYYHWPVYWFMPITLFGVSLYIWSYLIEQSNNKFFVNTIVYFLFFSLIYLAISFSEMYFIFFGILIFSFLSLHIYEIEKIKKFDIRIIWYLLKKYWKKITLSFLPFASYLVSYFYFLIFVSPEITRVSTKLSFNFDLEKIFLSIKAFFIAAFPLNVHNLSQARSFYIDFFEKNILSSNIQSIFILILFLIISVLASRMIMKLLQNEPSEKINTTSLRNFSLSLLFIFFLGYLFISIHVLTGLYQDWLQNHRPWYTPVFHFSVAILLLIILLSSRLLVLKNTLIMRGSIFLFFFLVIFTNLMSTMHVRSVLLDRNVPWHLLYTFKYSLLNKNINENDSLFFKDMPQAKKLERDELLSTFLNKKLNVYPNSSGDIKDYNWSFKIVRNFKHTDSYLIAGKKLSGQSGDLFSEIYVIPYSGTKKLSILVTNKTATCPELDLRRTRNTFLINVSDPIALEDVMVINSKYWRSYNSDNNSQSICTASKIKRL